MTVDKARFRNPDTNCKLEPILKLSDLMEEYGNTRERL